MSGDELDARGDAENDLLQCNDEFTARILLEDTAKSVDAVII